MKTIGKFTLVLASLIFVLGWQTLSAQAATPAASSATQASGSLTVALTTSGYEFTPEIGSLVPLSAGGSSTSLPPQVITAHMVVHNETTTDIPWRLYSGVTFEFTVYDSADKVVWDSLPKALPQFILLATLKAGESLNGMVAVPLFINGVALKPGVYTLEAKLFGSSMFTATTTFIVNNVIAIN